MSPSERYNRTRAYARASAHVHRIFGHVEHARRSGREPSSWLSMLYTVAQRREAHAYGRLPETCQRALRAPEVTP